MADKILDVKDLTISFKTDNGLVRAVRGVSFDLEPGETLCIVGESGSGKSVTSKAIMGILAANAVIDGGSIMYHGENLLEVSEDEFHKIRGNKIGMIFQDPLSSLNPIVRIGKQITEAMLINSDKLKLMFDELISTEQTSYNNCVSKRNINVKRINDTTKKHVEELKTRIRKAIEKIKKEELDEITTCKEPVAVALAALNNKKNEAKMHLSSYKSEKVELLQEKLNSLFEKLESTQEDSNEEVAKVKAEIKTTKADIKEAKAEFDKELNRLFEEFISNEKQAYDNSVAKCNAQIKEIKLATKEKIKNEKDASKKAEIKKQISEITAKAKVDIAAYEQEAKEKLPTLKAALKAKKAEAKVKVKEYKINTTLEYKTQINELKAKLASLAPEQAEEANELKAQIQAKQTELTDKFKITKAAAKARALEIMREVGIPLPERRFRQYPFEFSGGMRQRIVIAIALTASPEVLICDEPTTALDVTIQAQILELIKKIQKERNIACIFITHDLGVVANMADRVAVMYAGKIVEYGTSEEIFFEPKHPYTWALLSSIPDVDSKERLEAIPGTPPNMIFPPVGDAFALRSRYALEIDFKKEPPYFKVSDTHYAKTWLLHPNAPKVEMPKIVSERIKNALKSKEEVSSNE